MQTQIASPISKFHKTRLGYFVFGLVELGLAWLIVNKAMDNGNLLLWTLVLILLIGSLQNFVKMVVPKR